MLNVNIDLCVYVEIRWKHDRLRAFGGNTNQYIQSQTATFTTLVRITQPYDMISNSLTNHSVIVFSMYFILFVCWDGMPFPHTTSDLKPGTWQQSACGATLAMPFVWWNIAYLMGPNVRLLPDRIDVKAGNDRHDILSKCERVYHSYVERYSPNPKCFTSISPCIERQEKVEVRLINFVSVQSNWISNELNET